MIRTFFFVLLAGSLLISCEKDESFAEGTLGRYIADLGIPTQRDSLIACAASGQVGILDDGTSNNISVIFYPPEGAINYRYYELETPGAGQIDLRNFRNVELDDVPILNGYLRKFTANIADKLCLVTFLKNGKLFISDPITIKGSSQPTEYNPGGLNIFNTTSLSPSFAWNPSSTGTDVIYFQVVADANDNLISGTYTEGTSFQFYNTDNVVLNIRDVDPPPTLEANQSYKFIMMAVSDDNWVNTLIQEDFMTN